MKKHEGKKPICPEIEEKLFEWFKQKRAKQLPVSPKDLQEMAKKLAKEIPGVNKKFRASMGWVGRFLRRHQLSLRQRTRVSSRTASEMEVIIKEFYDVLNKKMETHNYEDIWNYDEVGVYFEPNIARTVDVKGARTVSIMSVKANSMKMTIVLLISASGRIAPPVLLYYNRKFEPFKLDEYPDILISSNPRGYNIEDTNYNTVIPHFLKYMKEGSLLLYDECTSHRSKRIQKLLESRQIDSLRIPGGTTCLLQPVDCNIGKIVKTEVRNCFMKWYTNNWEEITTPEGKRRKGFKKPTNRQMAEWVMHGVNKIRKEDVIGSFRMTGIISKGMQQITLKEKVPKFFIIKDSVKSEESERKSQKLDNKVKEEV